ncbi:hypothetical protein BaRGS_00032968 [Batillaria attramentaria]|uniref:Uncharacterized protein n=1 Tax=Batillaria attramentaria TaxID=370345 RepID=A0ABD0JLF0_9CAEN
MPKLDIVRAQEKERVLHNRHSTLLKANTPFKVNLYDLQCALLKSRSFLGDTTASAFRCLSMDEANIHFLPNAPVLEQHAIQLMVCDLEQVT